jgi:hypothetical protein
MKMTRPTKEGRIQVGLNFQNPATWLRDPESHNFIISLEINSYNSGEIFQPFSRIYITDIRIYYNKVLILLSAGTLTILILSWFPSVLADTFRSSTSNIINRFIPNI